MRAAGDAIRGGETDASVVRHLAVAQVPADPKLRLEYLEIVDTRTMQPVELIDRPVVVAGALWVGGTRLIDNVICEA